MKKTGGVSTTLPVFFNPIFMKKRILITGGAGFIGSHLCKRLLDEGNEVLCLDNYFTGNKENILPLIQHPYFEVIRHDIMNSFYAEVDEIYNLACPASPIHYQYDPIRTINTSVMGAINVLGLANRVKCKVMQASTSEVYGDPQIHPQAEYYWGNVNPIGIRSCYDEGKRCAETIFMDYHRQYKVKIKIIRIFNTYGPNMHPQDGRVVSNFIVQALQDKDLTIYGNGRQTRSFQYVDDLIRGMIKGNHRLFQKDFIKKRNGFTSLIRELRKPGQVKFYRFLTGGTSSLKTSIIRQEVFFIYRNSAQTCLSPVFSISKLQKRHE